MKEQIILTIILFVILIPSFSYAQLERNRVIKDDQVINTFLGDKIITMNTTENINKGELQYSIMHSFGEVNSGAQNLWGIDHGANVNINFEYGLSKYFTVGIGRFSEDKVYRASIRSHLFHERKGNGSPVSVSLNTSIGVTTIETDRLARPYTFDDRLNFSASVPIAKKVSSNISLLISPMVTHFNRTGPELNLMNPDTKTYTGIGSAVRYKFSPRMAFIFQSVIPTGDNEQLDPNFGIGLNIETGGHLFQIFFTNSQSLNESYLIGSPTGNVLEGEFRLGFNINRLFKLH